MYIYIYISIYTYTYIDTYIYIHVYIQVLHHCQMVANEHEKLISQSGIPVFFVDTQGHVNEVWFSVLQCVAVCCSVWQYVTMCCSCVSESIFWYCTLPHNDLLDFSKCTHACLCVCVCVCMFTWNFRHNICWYFTIFVDILLITYRKLRHADILLIIYRKFRHNIFWYLIVSEIPVYDSIIYLCNAACGGVLQCCCGVFCVNLCAITY